MKRSEILQRLEERLARGEISEKTYLDIRARYEAEPETQDTAVGGAPSAATIGEAVSRATEDATQAGLRAAAEALGSVDFSGIGIKLSDEAIRIMGSGSVSGAPVKTREFKAAGSARVRGNLEADSARVAGACDFDGDVQVDEFRSSGSSRVAGSLRADDVESSGSLQVDKDVAADNVAASGSLQVGGQVQCDTFHSSGSVRIQGGLKADDVSIELGGSSVVKSIEADDISVRRTGGFLRVRGELTAERIVGDDVYLEGTTAAYVKGDDVHVGPHCRIDVVEAHDLVVHESSEVKERRVPPT